MNIQGIIMIIPIFLIILTHLLIYLYPHYSVNYFVSSINVSTIIMNYLYS